MKRARREQLMSLFRETIADTNDVLSKDGVKDETMWTLARRLHDTWHRVMARLEDLDAEERRNDERGHPALAELSRLVSIEEDI